MAHFYLHGLLVFVLLEVTSKCRGLPPVIETVFASKEEDVVLPCFDSYDPKSCSRVKLIKYATDASQMEVILARPKTPNLQDARRVKWEAAGNERVSLFLTKTKQSDEGLYGCEIWQGWDCVHVKNISLKVRDCKTLEAVKAAPGTSVNLNCPVDTTSGQQGPQNISWLLVTGGNPVPLNSKRVKMNGTSLAIQSVNYMDSGWYRCKYELGQTQRCFDINLSIQEEQVVVTPTVPGLTTSEVILETKMEGSRGAFIAGVVALVIMGIVIMVALIGLFIYRRRNAQRVTQQTQRHTPGTLTDVYEIVNPTPLEESTNQVNSLYQEFLDESLCTFRY